MPTIINNKFSQLLGKRRLKISKIAEDTGISRTTLTDLYYDRTQRISFEVLEKLCGYLQCSVSDIFDVEIKKGE